MGEIADDIMDGNCCALCGQYFQDILHPENMYSHGYPVACDDCHDDDCGYPPQDEEAILL